MATWATTADVLEYTGTTVTDAQITQAQGVIDIISGVTPDGDDVISTRDQRLLKQALAYQTVWMVNQIDVFTRTDVDSLTQDGLQIAPGNDDALILAPLAKRCLDRLSWRKARSLRVRPGRGDTFPTIEAYQAGWLADAEGTNDWQQGWTS